MTTQTDNSVAGWFDRLYQMGLGVYQSVNPPAGYHFDPRTGVLIPDTAQYNGLMMFGLLALVLVLVTRR